MSKGDYVDSIEDERFVFTERAAETLDGAAVAQCWNRVSKNPPKYWKSGNDGKGNTFPYFICKDGGREFYMLVLEDDEGPFFYVCLPEDVLLN